VVLELDPRGAIGELNAAVQAESVSQRHVDAVIAILREHEDPCWRVRAVDVLDKVDGFPGQITSALIAALEDEGMDDGPYVPIPVTISEVASSALARRRDSAREAVIAGLSSGPPRQRVLALRWLTPAEVGDRLEDIIRDFGNPHMMVRLTAASRIAERIEEDHRLAQRLVDMVRADDARRSGALAALAGLTPSQIEAFSEVLLFPLVEEWPMGDQQRAASILGSVPGIRDVLDEHLLNLSVTDELEVRRRAVFLAGSGARRDVLELLLDDPEPTVRSAARKALRRLDRQEKS